MVEAVVLYPCLFFALLSFFIALHHLYAHSKGAYDRAREESCAACCYLQPSDMKNHEIWVVCSACISVTWLVAFSFCH